MIWSRSGDRRHALAETGGPVVVMWCVTLCLITPVVTLGWVTAGYSETIAVKVLEGLCGSRDGLGDGTVDMIPWTCKLVTVSMRHRWPMSTVRL